MASLYIVGTPIGNLEDLSRRALRIFSEVDLILCEDTRITKKLLDRCQIKTPVLSYHHHSKIKKIEHIINLLSQDKDLALASDAGTPGISDPGNKLIQEIVESRFLTAKKIKIIPVPGASALTAAASVSGFPMERFLFLGFPPAKKKRKKFFEEIIRSKYPVIFYESPYRIIKTLNELNQMFQGLALGPQVVVCRELTKKFETVYRGTIDNILKELDRSGSRGEFVVIFEAALRKQESGKRQ